MSEPNLPCPQDAEAAPFDFVVVSDAHVSLTKPYRAKRLSRVLQSVRKLAPAARVIVVGDTTDYGMPWEYFLVNRARRAAGLEREELLFALGNHECRLPPFQGALRRFRRFVGRPQAFYDVEAGRTHLIMLAGDEKPVRWDACRISSEQLTWLDSLLARDEGEGRASLVFNHEPLFDTVEGSLPEHPSGRSIDNDTELRAVLDAHPGAFVFTGHSHFRLDARRIGEGPVFANTGAIGYDDGYGRDFACGWFVRVEERAVTMRGRDFLGDRWLDEVRFEREVRAS